MLCFPQSDCTLMAGRVHEGACCIASAGKCPHSLHNHEQHSVVGLCSLPQEYQDILCCQLGQLRRQHGKRPSHGRGLDRTLMSCADPRAAKASYFCGCISCSSVRSSSRCATCSPVRWDMVCVSWGWGSNLQAIRAIVSMCICWGTKKQKRQARPLSCLRGGKARTGSGHTRRFEGYSRVLCSSAQSNQA